MIRPRAALAAMALAPLLLATPGVASAANPAGSYEIDLGGNQSIWLAVEDSEEEFCEGFAEGFGGSVQACDFALLLDAKGKLTGSLDVSAVNGNLSVVLAGPIKGSLKGDGSTGLSDLSFSFKLSGVVGNTSATTDVSARVSFAGEINGAGRSSGQWNSQFCSKTGGCLSEVDTATPETLAGGGWTLVLEISDLGGGKLGGNAAAELGDGSRCAYTISGKYSDTKDVASLKLSATNATCAGTSISLKDVRVASRLMAQMKYKIFGQRGDTAVESLDP